MIKYGTTLLVLLVVVAALCTTAVAADASTCKLELKRLEPLPVSGISVSQLPADYLLRRAIRPQSYFMQAGVIRRTVSSTKAFSDVITKELDEYGSEHPFRGVATLGSGHYGFVLDTKPAESDAANEAKEENEADEAKPAPPKPIAYNRLYFDLNGNGDLTDDKVIEAKPAQQRYQSLPATARPTSSYARFQFPRVDLKIDVDGKKADYAFFFSVYSRATSSYSYASASLMAAAYREGEIELNGKRHRIVLIDGNSNGRFDDAFTVRDLNGRPYPTYGDTLMVDPETASGATAIGYDLPGQQLSKLATVDGGLYDLEVLAGGSQLSMTPYADPIGYVETDTKGLRAVIYGDKGLARISGDDAKPTPVPVGKWKLVSYTIQSVAEQQPEKTPDEEKGPVMRMPRISYVAARGSADSQAFEVGEGETVTGVFGPPYKPVVSAPESVQGGQTVRLGMALVGAGGEQCASLIVEGSRPPQPELTITTPDGEEVHTGKFEYG